MAKTKNKALLSLVNNLTNLGEMAITTAYNARGYKNRTYNLHDSYASAVYVNGVLYRDTIRFVGNEMSKSDREINATAPFRTRPDRRGHLFEEGDTISVNGRDEAYRFFTDYRPPKGKGLELVLIAGMFYASILERRKYHVISDVTSILGSALNRINKEAGGGATLYKLDVWRNLDVYGRGSFTIKDKQLIKS